jgi:peptidoglycan lytic transglycosylase D
VHRRLRFGLRAVAKGRGMRRAWLVIGLMLLTSAALAGESSRFPFPSVLKPDVRFWMRIYTEVDTHGGLIHDDRYLGVVYEELHFPEGATDQDKEQQVQKAERRYREVLLKLAKGSRKGLKAEERRVLRLWRKGIGRRALREAAEHVRFQLGQADRFRAGLERSGIWLPYIREALRQAGLPTELAVLPHVESSFNPLACSKAGAAGLWQFTRATGRHYLRLDEVVDERFDPYRSTTAAVRLLKHDYRIAGTWPLAITAYNHGTAGVRRAVREMGTRDIARIVRRYRGPAFGFASRNFYVAFLAAVEAEQHARKYFGDLSVQPPDDSETAPVPAYVSVEALTRVLGVDAQTLKAHNPALQAPVWSGKKYVPRGFELRLPRHLIGRPLAVALADLSPAERFDAQAADRFYTVKRGDTLSEIALLERASVAELTRLNGLDDPARIRAGLSLRLTLREAPVRRDLGIPSNRAPVLAQAEGDPAGPDGEELDAQLPLASIPSLPASTLVDPAAAGPESPVLALGDSVGAEPVGFPSVSPERSETPVPVPQDGHHRSSDDPAGYAVARDGTIEVQAGETLGHYAKWLDLSSRHLGAINRLTPGQVLAVGRKLRLEFSRVSRAVFEARRKTYHQALRDAFFSRYRIARTEAYRMRPGDSLWVLAQRAAVLPLWLLRQYNPDLDAETVHPGTVVTIPRVEPRAEALHAPSGST